MVRCVCLSWAASIKGLMSVKLLSWIPSIHGVKPANHLSVQRWTSYHILSTS